MSRWKGGKHMRNNSRIRSGRAANALASNTYTSASQHLLVQHTSTTAAAPPAAVLQRRLLCSVHGAVHRLGLGFSSSVTWRCTLPVSVAAPSGTRMPGQMDAPQRKQPEPSEQRNPIGGSDVSWRVPQTIPTVCTPTVRPVVGSWGRDARPDALQLRNFAGLGSNFSILLEESVTHEHCCALVESQLRVGGFPKVNLCAGQCSCCR